MSRHRSATCGVSSGALHSGLLLTEARRWLVGWDLAPSCLLQLAFFRSLLDSLFEHSGI